MFNLEQLAFSISAVSPETNCHFGSQPGAAIRGIDLSNRRSRSSTSAGGANAAGSRLRVGFLSNPFPDDHFDIVYAHSVTIISERKVAFKSCDVIKPGRMIISFDPMKTEPLNHRRALYRPLQSDRAWEWPFDPHILDDQQYFVIESMQDSRAWRGWRILSISCRDVEASRGRCPDGVWRKTSVGPAVPDRCSTSAGRGRSCYESRRPPPP
jgi:hypothetical protein